MEYILPFNNIDITMQNSVQRGIIIIILAHTAVKISLVLGPDIGGRSCC